MSVKLAAYSESFSHAEEGDLVLAVDDEAHEGRNILDVGLLEEAQAAGDEEGDAAGGEFHLDFQALEVGAVEHGHFGERDAVFVEFEDALGDEGRLGVRVWQRDERGFRAECFARRAEVLLEAAGVMVSG